MAKTNSTKSNKVDPIRPFYAAVGTVDIAVAAARTGISEAQVRLAKVDFAPKAIPAQVEALVNDAVAELGETVDDLNKQYVDLAARGRTLVNRIRRQQATQDLEAAAKNTTSRAKVDHHADQEGRQPGREVDREVRRPGEELREGHRHLGQEDRDGRQAGHHGRRRQDRRLSSTHHPR